MKERKTEFHFFTIMEYEEEAAYLQDMRRCGWKLKKVTFPRNLSFYPLSAGGSGLSVGL